MGEKDNSQNADLRPASSRSSRYTLTMERILGRFGPQLYALMRIVTGLLFACHGAQKLFGVLGGQQVALVSQFGRAGVIEFVGGLMIAIGLMTGTVAFIASGEMAYAYFKAH